MTDDDKDWMAAFAPANAELPADPFTTRVMRRVQRRLWIRGAVLGTACVLGGVSAFGPLRDLLEQASTGFGTLVGQWHDATWYMQYGLPFIFLSVGFAWPILARWLAR